MKALLVALGCIGSTLAQEPTPKLTHGPFRGHVDATTLHVWARASEPGGYTLELVDVVGDAAKTAHAIAVPEHDLTLHFTVTGLTAATGFGLRILAGDAVVHASRGASWATSMADDAGAATIAFGSCANERSHPEQPIWEQITARSPSALVLLGDTPYIDDGTVDGRRRRHRGFFAFEPIAQVLATIPTWTTWDDHDYATNDAFGDAKGSETARSVFVDYHAHAGYGDGTRGIYTNFRRGPIEVFLLDTRTFADAETSLLAPGERSLLGAQQIDWLQRGLTASTAVFRVLACGMVWNGGVRPNKADCWGNWSAERDALFRWLGEQGVSGVVLVSGDVHRSRVILHPTAALAGYDLPEFVTSPLAQNVLESNKVSVPGLEFDASEASSCLFLSATHGPGMAGGSIEAMFVAGDGREFHRRAFTVGELRAGDAAAVYRRVERMLHAVFGEQWERAPEHDHEVTGGVGPGVARDATWRAAVAAARPALAEWGKAVAQPSCHFAPVGKDPPATEFFDRFQGLVQLRGLALAHGQQALVDRDEGGFDGMVHGLLVMARHLFQEPTMIAWLVAHDAERCALQLVQQADLEWPAVAAAGRRAVQQHITERPGFGALAVPAEQESLRLLDPVLQALQADERTTKGALARRLGSEARRLCTAALGEHLAPLQRLGGEPDAAVRAELVRRAASFEQRLAAVRERLRVRTATDAPQPGDAADLADLLLSLAVPNLVGAYDAHVVAWQQLQAAAAGR